MSTIRARFERSGFEIDAKPGEAIMDITMRIRRLPSPIRAALPLVERAGSRSFRALRARSASLIPGEEAV
jgi:hypothetical protein